MVLYNKYRPTDFSLVCGQEHVKKILSRQIERRALSNAYLFIGQAGTGKTTLARILSSMVNCSTGMTLSPNPEDKFVRPILAGNSVLDVYEVDGASKGKVDDVRELRQMAEFAPIEMRKKIWIIDECHKLSTDAWQAFLKILEEPPSHVMFIFCTTEPKKIPDTILTRAMVFQFHVFSQRDVVAHLRKIVDLEGRNVGDDCLSMVAAASRGSMRQALSLLEKVLLLESCTPDEISKTITIPSRSAAREYVYSALKGKFEQGLVASSGVIASGVSAQNFLEEVANYIHDLMLCGMPNCDLGAYGCGDDMEQLKAFFDRMSGFFDKPLKLLQDYIQYLDAGHKLTVYNVQPQFHVDAVWVTLYMRSMEYRKETGSPPQNSNK